MIRALLRTLLGLDAAEARRREVQRAEADLIVAARVVAVAYTIGHGVGLESALREQVAAVDRLTDVLSAHGSGPE